MVLIGFLLIKFVILNNIFCNFEKVKIEFLIVICKYFFIDLINDLLYLFFYGVFVDLMIFYFILYFLSFFFVVISCVFVLEIICFGLL